MRRHARVLFAVAALASFFAFATLASAGLVHPFKASVGSGQLGTPRNVAVDQSNGNLYATSYFGSSIQRIDSSGAPAPFSALGTNTIEGFSWDGAAMQLAVDNSGGANDTNFYATNSFGGGIQAFKSTGEPANFSASAAYIAANTLSGTPSGAFTEACGVAIDANGAIYVGDLGGQVSVYAPSGQYLTQAAVPSACNVAVDSAGNLYVNAQSGAVSLLEPSAFPVTAATTYGAPTTVTSAASSGIAVDPADDNLYVNNGSFIAQYDSAANANAPLGLFGVEELADSRGLAIDRSGGANDGDVLAQPSAYASELFRFDAPPVLLPDVSTGNADGLTGSKATLHGTLSADGGPAATCQFAYVTDAAFQADRYAGAQTAPCSPAGPFTGTGDQAVAANLTGLTAETTYHFRLQATNANGTNPGFTQTFTTPSAVKAVTTGAAANLTPSSATLNGTVTPGALELSECKFEYGLTDSYGQSAPCAESNASIGTGEAPVAVHADVTGLATRDYHFRLVAVNADGTTLGGEAGFSVVAPPIIGGETSSLSYPEASYAEAVLRGEVNPGNGQTSYHFEYGTTIAYDESTTVRQLPVGINPRDVLALVSPLEKGVTYHFRLVASNSAGTTKGADQTFTVEGAAPSDTCANASIRAKQGSAHLPDCRAYELVSPAAKGNLPVDQLQTVQSSPDGDAVAYVANGAFPGAVASVLHTYYLARRSAQGWSSGVVDSPQFNAADRPARTTRYFSADLTRAFQFSGRALLPGAFEGGGNLYLRDNLSRALTLAASDPGPQLANELVDVAFRWPIGASDDLSRVVFQSRVALTPDAPVGVNNVYEFADGQLKLVNYLPDGSVDPAGARMNPRGAQFGQRFVSDDGERTVFQAPFAQFHAPLYLRVNGTTTVPVSVSRVPGDPDTPMAVSYGGGSDDLRHLYFTSQAPLLPGAPTGSNLIYRYDVGSKDLTLAASEGEVTAVSGDGSTVYYRGVDEADTGLSPLYATRNGVIKRIATLGFTEAAIPALAISPNGRYFAFETPTKVTESDNTSPRCSNEGDRCTEVYLFDFQSGGLECVSCGPVDGVNAVSNLGGNFKGVSEYLPRALDDSGRLFFNSDARLVTADVNEQTDVYEWRNGDIELISPAGGQDPSYFADASADGRSIFFASSQQVVAEDSDGEADLYSARVDGGLAGQNQPPVVGPSACVGEACRGPLSSPSRAETPGTGAFSGPANTKPRRPHKKKRPNRKRHAKKGQAKKKAQAKKAHSRAANSNRGGGR